MRLVSGYCDKSAKEKVEKMIDVDTKVAQKSQSEQLHYASSIPEDHAIIIITLQHFLYDIIFSQ